MGEEMETENKKDCWDKAKICAYIVVAIILFAGGVRTLFKGKKDVEVHTIKLEVGIVKEDYKPRPSPKSPTFGIGIEMGSATTWAENVGASQFPVAILSQPPGAEVYVDGVFAGKTSLLMLIPAGEREVKLKLKDEERIVRIKPSVTNTVNVNFDRKRLNEKTTQLYPTPNRISPAKLSIGQACYIPVNPEV
jgi:hypothetical protein